MKKNKKTVVGKSSLTSTQFSETWLVAFAMIFAAIGAYTFLHAFAAPEGAAYISTSAVSSDERAWFSSLGSAAYIILLAAPIAVFLLWWVWRKSEFVLWLKLILTVIPTLAVTAFAK